MELDLEELDNLRADVETLQEKRQKLQESLADLEATKKERDYLRRDLEIANIKLQSRNADRERFRKAYEREISEFKNSALAASQAKLQQVKKTHYRLLDQCTELQMRVHELEGKLQAERGRNKGRSHMHDLNRMANKTSIQAFSSQNNNTSSSVSGYAPRFLRPQVYTGMQEDGYHSKYHSPLSNNGPPAQSYPARPVRLESLKPRKANREPTSPTDGLSAPYGSSLTTSFQAPNAPETVISNGKSAFSVETSSSKGEKKEKIAPKSDVRVYGRGGAQNIGKKFKDKAKKAEKKDKALKSGGFRGLKGIIGCST